VKFAFPWMILLASSLTAVLAIDETILNQQQQSISWRRIVVNSSDFSVDKLEGKFRSLLADEGSRFRVIKLEVFIDRNEARNGNCKCSTDVTYGLWKELYREYEKGLPASAELLMIDGNAAMRVRGSDGAVTLKLLHGNDPYNVYVDRVGLRLIHMATIPRESQSSENERTRALNLAFFMVTASSFNESTARAAVEKLRRVTGSEGIELEIRADPWFIASSDFPVVPPYIQQAKPPSEEEYAAGLQWTCLLENSRTRCWKQGPQKISK